MKVVTNAIPLLSPLTGVGKYTYNMVAGFLDQRPEYNYTYFYGYFTKKLRYYKYGFYEFKEFVKKRPVVSQLARLLTEKMPLVQMENYDLYFEPNFIPLNIRARRIVTTVFDFSFYLYPEWHPEGRVRYFSKNFFDRISSSDVVITISDYIAKEAREIIRPQNTEIVSIPLGYDENIFNRNGNAGAGQENEGNFILFVGSIEPRKNLHNLLRAYLSLPEYLKKEFRLVLVGFKGWENEEVMKMLEQLNGKVEYLGYVSDEDLADLYRRASCFVYPSFYEGFGLPPLEAMACGCPVVVSDRSSLPEVCGDAALYVDPHSVESIAEGIHTVLTDTELREGLAEKGTKRTKHFSWRKTVEEHIRVFEGLTGSKG